MLKKTFKNYILEIVKDKYQKIDKNFLSKTREKINNFDRFLDVYSEDEAYKDKLNTFYLELSKMVLDEKTISLNKINFLDIFIDILCINKGVDKQEFSFDWALEILNKLNLIKDNIYKNININNLDGIQDEKVKIIVKGLYTLANPEDTDNINIYWDNISNIFITYLELGEMLKDDISEKYILQKLNIDEYIRKIRQNYESKINFKYIPASVLKITNYDYLDSDETNEEEIIGFKVVNEQYTKIKLIGYAGVGKTTTLEYVEYEDALKYDETGKIPVLINLITVDTWQSIEELICRKLQVDKDNEEIVNYLLKCEKINIYLDGINEINIFSSKNKQEFLITIEEFFNKKENQNIKMIITDRDNDELSVLNDLDTFLIQGMNEDDIEMFIEGNSNPEKTEEVKRVIKNHPEMFDVFTHPFMLKNIITIIECGEKIPDDSSEIISIYLNSIIKREIYEKKDDYAKYIDGILKYLLTKITQSDEVNVNPPISHFKLIPIFYEYSDKEGIQDFNADRMLNLLIKLGILREVEFEKYTFADEQYFEKYYNDIINEI